MEGSKVPHPDVAQDKTLCFDAISWRCVRHCKLFDLGISRAESHNYEKVLRNLHLVYDRQKMQHEFHSGHSLTSMHRGI